MEQEYPVTLPSPDEIQAMFAKAYAEQHFWEEHGAALQERYPREYVAVRPTGEVVLTASNLDDLLRRLERQGVARSEVYTRYMWPKGTHIICSLGITWLDTTQRQNALQFAQ